MRLIGTLVVGLVSLIACGIGRLFPSTPVTNIAIGTVACVEPQQVVTRRIDFGTALESSEDAQSASAGTSSDRPGETSEALANLRHKVSLLEEGEKFLAGVETYCAKLSKREVVGGELLDEQTIQLKCRQKPFSVYLHWLSGDVGREVLYIEGRNNGKMIAHDGGWKARLPAVTVDPNGWLAMRDARYPVTAASLGSVTTIMLETHREDLAQRRVASCTAEDNLSFDGRRCIAFTTEYSSRESSPVYRKSITYIDREWNLPVHTRHFEWPAAGKEIDAKNVDDSTLIESYSFSDVKLPYTLNDSDFDRDNSEYRFR